MLSKHEHIPISRAALSLRPMLIQKEAAQLRKDYQSSLRRMLENENVYLIAKRIEREHPNLIIGKLGARAVSISTNGLVTIRCLVNTFGDAAPVLHSLNRFGYKHFDDPQDSSYTMSRTFRLGKRKYYIDIELILSLPEDNTDCKLVIKEYYTPDPYPIYEIVCNETEAELKTDMGGSWSD